MPWWLGINTQFLQQDVITALFPNINSLLSLFTMLTMKLWLTSSFFSCQTVLSKSLWFICYRSSNSRCPSSCVGLIQKENQINECKPSYCHSLVCCIFQFFLTFLFVKKSLCQPYYLQQWAWLLLDLGGLRAENCPDCFIKHSLQTTLGQGRALQVLHCICTSKAGET